MHDGGDLRGMFDGQTTGGIDLTAPVVVLDLSAVYSSSALGILMTCATAWLHAALRSGDAVRRIVVVGLLADVETRVVYGQPPSEVEGARDLLGLSEAEADLLPRLPRGVALWKVGLRTFLVEHRLGRAERAFVDTDARMRTDAGGT
jgi:hypothetical protein